MTRPTPALVAAVNAAAWLADRALTRLAPSPTRGALEAENLRLRKRNSELQWEVIRLTQIHLPADDLDDLAAVETFQDFLWLTGEDA